MSNQNHLKVVRAEIKNFKNIEAREIDVAGRTMVIAGPNQAGKSSLIQALMSPLNSKYVPLEPIKQGEEKGHVVITLGGEIEGESVTYKVGCYFSQGNKRGRLTLHDKDGSPIKGGERGILEGLIGDISFDIMDFINLGITDTGKVSKTGVKEQINILKELMPREDLKRLFALDHEKQEKYDLRTEVNRDIKYLQGQIDNAGFTQEEIEKYSEELSAEAITEKIKKANAKNEQIEKCWHFEAEYETNIQEIDQQIEEFQKLLDGAKKEKEDLKVQKRKIEKFFDSSPDHYRSTLINISELESQYDTISDHNTKVAQVKALDETKSKLTKKTNESQSLSDRLTKIEEEKKTLFSETDMPVKGLAFDEEKVTYKGLPLSEGNIPTSQLIGIGFKIGMALNPTLRLGVIKDGSLLDNKTMEFLLKQCEKNDYQLLIEMVKHDGGDLSIEFVEK